MNTQDYQTASTRLRELSKAIRQNVPHLKLIDDAMDIIRKDFDRALWNGVGIRKERRICFSGLCVPMQHRMNERYAKRQSAYRAIREYQEHLYHEFIESH